MIVDIIPRSALVGFSLLRARGYYYKKGAVCYVLTFYSQYSYGELSILFLFILSRDKLAYVHLMLLYFYIQQIRCLYYVLFGIITEYFFLTYFESDLVHPKTSTFSTRALI